ncbi:MAG TPA: hypothetical protein VLG50_07125 [Candidatus Saccharimonadales bacterium]|nr:hypothetical protein [Candidatus Saccharimonadales bacterium]
MSLSIYTNFYNYLNQCITNQDEFCKFKTSSHITGITEHPCLDQYKDGFVGQIVFYADQLHLDVDDVLTSCMINDQYGSPFLSSIVYQNKTYQISPNTLRYIYNGLHMLLLFKNNKNNKSSISIVELGGGYGGQCLILYVLTKMLSITITSYMVIDFYPVCQFITHYLCYFNIHIETNAYLDNHIHDLTNHYDLFISNYCLGELPFPIQKYYIDKIFNHIDSYYIQYNNFWQGGDVHPDLLAKNPTLLPEIPLTGTDNKLIIGYINKNK